MCLLLAICLTVLSGCRRKQPEAPTAALEYTDPYADFGADHDRRSEAIYADTLNDFFSAYQTALQAETVSQRHALMAVAEAKLL